MITVTQTPIIVIHLKSIYGFFNYGFQVFKSLSINESSQIEFKDTPKVSKSRRNACKKRES